MQKKLVVVLDTNILVSGLLSPHGTPGVILQKFRRKEFEVVTSKDQVREIQDVLRRPSLSRALPKGSTSEVLRFFLSLKKLVTVHKPTTLKWDFSDEGDHFLLDLAVGVKADFLITGDKRLSKLTFVDTCVIIAPADFLARIS